MSDGNVANPVGGTRVRAQIEDRDPGSVPTNPQTLIVEPPEVADVTDASELPVLPYLTPDAMLVYCQSRLNGINTQCRDIMTRQEKNSKAQAALGDLLSKLNLHEDGAKDDALQDVRTAYAKAIDAVGPNTELGQKLAQDVAMINGKGEASKNDMSSLITAAKSSQSKLNSDAEIDMIRLQSLMSQRQTAVQLTTNIVQALNDTANKVVANIGH